MADYPENKLALTSGTQTGQLLGQGLTGQGFGEKSHWPQPRKVSDQAEVTAMTKIT